MEERPNGLNTEEKFYSSTKSALGKRRIGVWVGVAIGFLLAALKPGRSATGLALNAVFLLAIGWALDALFRRRLKGDEVLVTLDDKGIASPLFPGKRKRHAWTDISSCAIEAAHGTPLLQLRLAPSAGIPDKRSFWSGANHARPSLILSPFTPEVQERLVDAVTDRLVAAGVVPRAEGEAARNPLAVEREFQAHLKALAPIPWVSYALIALNVGGWGLSVAAGGGITHTPTEMLLAWGGNAASEVQRGEWWRLLSATFLHGGILHLAMNMLGLAGAGPTVERIYGHRLFVLIYLAAGLLGSALSLHFSAQHAVSVGASGAIFGVTGALLVAVFQHRDRLPKAFGKQTLSGIGFFVLYSLLQGFGRQGIDNAAHVGGLLGGCLLAFILPERFDMASFRLKLKSRSVAALAIAGASILALVGSAPPAAIDLSRLVTGAAFATKGMKGFGEALKTLEQEHQDVLAGKLSELEADERSRTDHAPIFRAVLDDLKQAYLPPGDPRAPVLADTRRLTELMVEALAMASVVDETTGKIAPADPVRAAAIQAEVLEVTGRIEKTASQLKIKAPR